MTPRNLFLTRVAAVATPGADARNAALKAKILELRDHRPSMQASKGSPRE